MIVRILSVFLIICLALVYGISSFIQSRDLRPENIVSLSIQPPDDKLITFETADAQDSPSLGKLVNWFKSGKLTGITLAPKSKNLVTFSWKLGDGKVLTMYSASKFNGSLLVQDLKLPLVYNFSVPAPPELESLQVFQTQ